MCHGCATVVCRGSTGAASQPAQLTDLAPLARPHHPLLLLLFLLLLLLLLRLLLTLSPMLCLSSTSFDSLAGFHIPFRPPLIGPKIRTPSYVSKVSQLPDPPASPSISRWRKCPIRAVGGAEAHQGGLGLPTRQGGQGGKATVGALRGQNHPIEGRK